MRAHHHDLRAEVARAGTGDETLADRIEHDHRSAGLEPRWTTLLDYAVKLTRTPGRCVASDVEALRRAGLGDAEIHDGVQVAAYFNYINRIADGLGVDLEPEMGARPGS